VGEDSHYFIEPNLPDTRSEVALPLIARGRLLGVLDVQSQQANAFQEVDISALQVMADQIASGLDNARLFEETRGQANLLAELQNVTSLMNQQANTRNALNVLAQRAMNLLDTDGGGVWLWRPEEKRLVLIVSFNIGENTTGQQLSPGEGLSGRSFSENTILVIEDYATWSGQSGPFAQIGFHAALAVPLRRQNEPIGVLALTRSQEDRPFKPDQVQIAELLAAQVGAVVINNQLIEETRRLVQRERAINQASAQIRRSLDAKTILDTTTGELGEIFGNKLVRARLFPQEESGGEAATREEVEAT
jgi:sigma-B regulation protein RsbU (phosphoserine phosphatase)